jgi:hypothetical protein
MIDLSTASPAVVITVFVGVTMVLIRKLLEKTIASPTSDLHDDIFRLTAVALGIAFVFGYLGLPASRAAFWATLELGVSSGLGSLGLFHLLLRTKSDNSLPDVSGVIAQALSDHPAVPAQAIPSVTAAVQAALKAAQG